QAFSGYYRWRKTRRGRNSTPERQRLQISWCCGSRWHLGSSYFSTGNVDKTAAARLSRNTTMVCFKSCRGPPLVREISFLQEAASQESWPRLLQRLRQRQRRCRGPAHSPDRNWMEQCISYSA